MVRFEVMVATEKESTGPEQVGPNTINALHAKAWEHIDRALNTYDADALLQVQERLGLLLNRMQPASAKAYDSYFATASTHAFMPIWIERTAGPNISFEARTVVRHNLARGTANHPITSHGTPPKYHLAVADTLLLALALRIHNGPLALPDAPERQEFDSFGLEYEPGVYLPVSGRYLDGRRPQYPTLVVPLGELLDEASTNPNVSKTWRREVTARRNAEESRRELTERCRQALLTEASGGKPEPQMAQVITLATNLLKGVAEEYISRYYDYRPR